MEPLDYAHIDFRDEAVAASREFLRQRGLPEQGNLAEVGTSCCFPAPGESERLQKTLRVTALLVTVFAFGFMAAGITIPLLTALRRIPTGPVFVFSVNTWIAVLFVFIGYVAMMSAVAIRNRLVIGYLRKQTAKRPYMSFDPVPIVVSIEDVQTVNRMKLATEDAAAVYPHPDRRLVVLEGYSHRYVIRGEDVLGCTLNRHLNVQGVDIVFRVCGGPVMLKLRVVQVSVAYALFRQPSRNQPQSPLPGVLETSLGITIGGIARRIGPWH